MWLNRPFSLRMEDSPLGDAEDLAQEVRIGFMEAARFYRGGRDRGGEAREVPAS
jgi:DNA-directed RNA polymerase specialized sigma24 family protein